jgi:hypothetical protein
MHLAIAYDHLPPFTLLPRAANIRSVHTDTSTHCQLVGPQASTSCLAVSGTEEASSNLNSICICIDISHPTFLPPFPRPGFATQDFRLFNHRYYEGSESYNPSPRAAGLPTYCDLPSCRSTSNHVMCLLIALSTTTSSTVIFRLHPKVGGSPAHPAESSSLSCGPTVRIRLLPTLPHDNAVTFCYGAVAYFGMDLHHADKSPLWAHN